MTSSQKRDNEYWAGRLEKDGHDDILADVRSGKISMHKARKLAGYLKSQTSSPASKLSYHWKRANAQERKRFVRAHLIDINRVVRETGEELRAMKAR